MISKLYGEENNANDLTIDAGNTIEVKCKVILPNINEENIEVQVYYGQIMDNGIVDNIHIIPMKLVEKDEANRTYGYKAKVELSTGGDFGYTFRAVSYTHLTLPTNSLV